jgi:DNA invertase Pin-like site-specific DNA recombinase
MTAKPCDCPNCECKKYRDHLARIDVVLDTIRLHINGEMFLRRGPRERMRLQMLINCVDALQLDGKRLYQGEEWEAKVPVMKQETTNRKLAPKEVVEIRRMLEAGFSKAQIGRAFGITAPTVAAVQNGETWARTKE